jgi:hypothetical protein
MWEVTVAGLAVFWFANPAGAVQLESWDNIIPNANARFKVLQEFNGEAVLDKETGLVWEQSPPAADAPNWFTARLRCFDKNGGGRKGWRLPTIAELASLIDPSVAPPGPTLTPGHTFFNVRQTGSASGPGNNAADVWIANFANGGVGGAHAANGTLHYPRFRS